MGRFNTIGSWTLYKREVARYMKIPGQTVAAPMTTAILFMAVFAVAVGDRISDTGNIPYVVFLGPGLVMMAALQNAFANTSTSMVVSKVQGNVVDFIMPPLGPFELMAGMVAAGITRGLMVGVVTAGVLALFGSSAWPVHPLLALMYLTLGSAVMALAGLITGIWSEKFDALSAITNFVILPMVFLSGTFYSIDQLPEPFDEWAQYNPVFHMIDGYRSAVIGEGSFSPLASGMILLVIMIGLGVFCWRILTSGYKLKA
jgi:ABC-2 type transport system permease protein